jgi:hypothetical protein
MEAVTTEWIMHHAVKDDIQHIQGSLGPSLYLKMFLKIVSRQTRLVGRRSHYHGTLL